MNDETPVKLRSTITQTATLRSGKRIQFTPDSLVHEVPLRDAIQLRDYCRGFEILPFEAPPVEVPKTRQVLEGMNYSDLKKLAGFLDLERSGKALVLLDRIAKHLDLPETPEVNQ